MATDTASLEIKLIRIVGTRNTFTGPDAAEYGRDHRGVLTGPVIAAVRPGSTEEAAAVVQACAADRIPMVTQGGNTGLSGGAQPVDQQPSIVISLSRMRAIESIDADNSTATVQAGVTIQQIQEAAAEAGLLFAPDWGARGSASIGGAISTNAGGINVLQFGPMRDHVLGLEVVLADGRVWDGLTGLRKDSSGYQLRQFFIGAEGTLGIITRAVVRLLPPIADHQSAILALPRLESVVPLLALARRATMITGFELIPEIGMAAATERRGFQRPLDTTTDWYVLLRIASPKGLSAESAMTSLLAGAVDSDLVADAAIAATSDQEENLWAIRDELAAGQLWGWPDGFLKYDTAVPVGRVVELLRGVEAITQELGPDWRQFSFGHVGDGNIHVHVLPPDRDWDPSERARMKEAIDALTFELGGTLSAEHGIGQVLRDQMLEQKDEVEQELAWSIKQALDPLDLLNPGKTLPPR